ncbi:MAG: outer membrane beta-barrel protein [Rhizobium sp.]|nr:outer membrane beta-barrel protein [Rhizobium sp.]
MTKYGTTALRGARRLGLRGMTALLAAHVFALPLPLAAQQATTPASPTSGSTNWQMPANGSNPTTTDTDLLTGPTDPTATAAVTDPTTTATTPPATLPQLDGDNLDPDAVPVDDDIGRQNLRETRLDNPAAARIRRDEEADMGVRLGTLVLRPAINQQIGIEREKTASGTENRVFSETGLKGTLTSDWSRHQLTIGGEGAWQETLSGDGTDKPRARIDADLRLDLADDTIANITGAYSFSREDTDDPNALSGASVQSGVHQFDGAVSVERDLGLLRGSIATQASRYLYSDAELSDGTTVDRSDRDRTRATVSARLGIELSTALTPFIEATTGKVIYDDSVDSAGYRRSADIYGAKTGVTVDLGEKLRGEVAIGYEQQRFDDARLAELSAVTVDGNIFWSPREGTTIDVTLATTLDPSTAAGVSGAAVHSLDVSLAHDIRSNLVARLTGGAAVSRYDDAGAFADKTVYNAGAGLTWKVNRYLDATADLTYERNDYTSTGDTDTVTALVGLTAKR